MARHQPKHLASSHRSRLRRRGFLVVALLAAAGATTAVWAFDQRPADVAAAGTTTTEPPTTAPTTASTTTTTPARQATLLFGGDMLIHQGVWQRAAVPGGHDFSPMLDPIASLVDGADLAICHLEVTLARPGEGFTGYPRFRAPAALATDMAEAGFDGCSVASNHSLDYGESGVAATLDMLDAAGLRHAGTARSPEEDQVPARYDAAGIAVAHLSYAYGFNGLVPPSGKEWLVDQIDPTVIIADARAARAAGAELVVVSLHWGNEYAHGVTAEQEEVAVALAAEPGLVDVIAGHHAHVVQPISRIGDMVVIWGMGNLLSNNSPGCCTTAATDGVLVTVTVADRADRSGVEVTSVRYTPTWNERSTFQILPAAEILAQGTPEPLASALRASYERTKSHITSRTDDPLDLAPTAPLP